MNEGFLIKIVEKLEGYKVNEKCFEKCSNSNVCDKINIQNYFF